MESAASSSRSNSISPTPEDHDVQSSRCSTPDSEVVESYHNLMNSLLPPLPASAILSKLQAADDEVDNEITMESGEKRPMTKAEKQNAKKKRRKERERDMKAEIVSAEREAKEREERAKPVAFRLFSTDTAKDVSLLPAAEDYPIPLNPRHVPQSDDVLAAVRGLARQSAVDPSTFSTDPDTAGIHGRSYRRQFKVLHAKGPLAPIFLVKAQTDKDKPKPIPRIHLFDPSPASHKKRQRTKRGRKEA